MEDLVTDVPLEFDFLFSRSHAEVISGKQEGERFMKSARQHVKLETCD